LSLSNRGPFSRGRGWIAIVAGAFIVILLAWVWIYIARQATVPGAILCDTATRGQFLGRIYVAFALIVACGLLAIGSGVRIVRTGRTSWIVSVALASLFIAACIVGANGAAACNPL